ncbi:Exosome component 5 [Quaeritorhiza haematococci]|nr:Exosome component 5 [Quaeritorhiza haematococci]
MHSVHGLLNRPDGSAKFSFDEKSTVLCSVIGPAEVKIRDEQLDKATLDVIFKPLVGVSTTRERLYESVLAKICESTIALAMHPRTLIQITAQVLADDGSILSAAVNATTLALIDAGIPMKSLVASVTCMVDQDGELVLDPTLNEMENARSVHFFAFDNVNDGVIASQSTGIFSEDEYFACHDLCKLAVEKVHLFMRMAIERRLAKLALKK